MLRETLHVMAVVVMGQELWYVGLWHYEVQMGASFPGLSVCVEALEQA